MQSNHLLFASRQTRPVSLIKLLEEVVRACAGKMAKGSGLHSVRRHGGFNEDNVPSRPSDVFNPCEDAEIQRRIFPARSIKQFQAGDLVKEIERIPMQRSPSQSRAGLKVNAGLPISFRWMGLVESEWRFQPISAETTV